MLGFLDRAPTLALVLLGGAGLMVHGLALDLGLHGLAPAVALQQLQPLGLGLGALFVCDPFRLGARPLRVLALRKLVRNALSPGLGLTLNDLGLDPLARLLFPAVDFALAALPLLLLLGREERADPLGFLCV
jgi:hypothetical protein